MVLEAAPDSREPTSLHLCFRLGFLANSSFTVEPAAMLPRIAGQTGAVVIEVNPFFEGAKFA